MDEVAKTVVVYGSVWCGFTQYTLQQLEALQVSYRFVDIDECPDAMQQIAEWNQGRIVRPTLDLSGVILFNPDPLTLGAELRNCATSKQNYRH